MNIRSDYVVEVIIHVAEIIKGFQWWRQRNFLCSCWFTSIVQQYILWIKEEIKRKSSSRRKRIFWVESKATTCSSQKEPIFNWDKIEAALAVKLIYIGEHLPVLRRILQGKYFIRIEGRLCFSSIIEFYFWVRLLYLWLLLESGCGFVAPENIHFYINL